jgi:hypothetical protein
MLNGEFPAMLWLKVVSCWSPFFIGKSPGTDCALSEQSLRTLLRLGGMTIGSDFVRFAQISARASLSDKRSEPMTFQLSQERFIANHPCADRCYRLPVEFYDHCVRHCGRDQGTPGVIDSDETGHLRNPATWLPTWLGYYRQSG